MILGVCLSLRLFSACLLNPVSKPGERFLAAFWHSGNVKELFLSVVA